MSRAARRFGIAAVALPSMSHHRETVTAEGAPAAAGPYSHAVKSNGLVFLLRPGAARSRHRPARRGLDRRPDAPLPRQPRDRRRGRRRAARRRRPHAASTSPTSATFKDVNEAYGTYFETDPPARTTIGVAALPLGAEVEIDAVLAAARLMSAVTADDVAAARPAVETIARRTPMLSSRTISERAGGVGRAEGREPAAHRLVQGPRRRGQARRARRRGCTRGRRRRVGRQPRAGARRRRARARRARARCSCPTDAPIAKVEAARGQGATVHVGGDSVDACLDVGARARATRAGWRSCTRSTTPTSSPARARSGSSCSRTCPTSPRSSSRSAAAGCAPGVAIAIKAARPGRRGRRRAGRRLRAVPGVAAARRAGARHARR